MQDLQDSGLKGARANLGGVHCHPNALRMHEVLRAEDGCAVCFVTFKSRPHLCNDLVCIRVLVAETGERNDGLGMVQGLRACTIP